MANQHTSRPRLGRGLSSLISNSAALGRSEAADYQPVVPPVSIPDLSVARRGADGQPREIPVGDIAPNPYQPRRTFRQEELDELAQSIAQQGILQPLVVTPADGQADKPFMLIAGERRLRAARQANLASVPCVIRAANRQQMLTWALIENIQRADLNCLERAQAYRDCMDRFNLSQSQVAEYLSEPRSTVANYLRVLDLGDVVQNMLVSGELSFGHAKVLAGLAGDAERQALLARKVTADGLSVRQLEELLARQDMAGEAPSAAAPAAKCTQPPHIRDLEERMTQAIGTRVYVRCGRAKNSGRIIVEYYSLDDFDRISQRLGLGAEG